MESKSEQRHYHVFLFNGFFCDEDNECVRLDEIVREELDTLISIIERQGPQDTVDMVIRPYRKFAGDGR